MNENLQSWLKTNKDEKEITARLLKQLEGMNQELQVMLQEIEREAAASDSHVYQKQTFMIKIRGLKRHYTCLAQNSDALMKELEALIREEGHARRARPNPGA